MVRAARFLSCLFSSVSIFSGSGRKNIYSSFSGVAAFVNPPSTLTQSSDRDSRVSTKRSYTTMMDEMKETFDDVYWFNEVTSTMDKAKEIIKSNPSKETFSVVAAVQTKGRGTRGRTWTSAPNNLFMTVVFKMSSVPIPLTLMPLRIGTLIAPSLQKRVQPPASVYLKWPNDLLIDERKVCGILIEIENDRVIVGIGCNVGEAPYVNPTGTEGGRPSTCLANHNEELRRVHELFLAEIQQRDSKKKKVNGGDGNANGNGIVNEECHVMVSGDDATVTESSCVVKEKPQQQQQQVGLGQGQGEGGGEQEGEGLTSVSPICREIALEISLAIKKWIHSSDSGISVISDFDKAMTKAQQRLRSNGEVPGALVMPLGLNADGTLRVQYEDGREDILVADYLF